MLVKRNSWRPQAPIVQSILPDIAQWLVDIQTQMATLKCQAEQYDMVLYTDGGCRLGTGGWGIHGYLYTHDVPKQGHGCKGFTPTAKGYINKEVGDEVSADVDPVVVTPVQVLQYIQGRGSIPMPSTNNEAEAVALIYALEIVRDLKPASVRFILDSEYVLKGCTIWMSEWVRNGFRKANGDVVSNVKHWHRIRALLDECMAVTTFSWAWTKGHSDDVGNTLSDHNASAGVFCGHKGYHSAEIGYKPIRKYWAPEYETHPFFDCPQIYFNTGRPTPRLDDLHVYYQGDHGPDDRLLGQPSSTTMFSVIAIPEAEAVVESVRADQAVYAGDIGDVYVIGRANTIFKPKIYEELLESKTFYMDIDPDHKSITTSGKQALTRVKHPTELAPRAFDQLELLEARLRAVRAGTLGERYCLTDITSLIYEQVEVKKATVLRTVPGLLSMAAVAAEVDFYNQAATQRIGITLTIGIDIPRRNFFAAITGRNPTVHVLTWPEPCSAIAFRYAVVVLTDKECGIWAGVYSGIKRIA